jgi:hypothetical protein
MIHSQVIGTLREHVMDAFAGHCRCIDQPALPQSSGYQNDRSGADAADPDYPGEEQQEE